MKPKRIACLIVVLVIGVCCALAILWKTKARRGSNVSWRNAGTESFLANQNEQPRVHVAILEKSPLLEAMLREKNLSLRDLHILIVAYKESKTLELYGKAVHGQKYELLKTYPICALSGKLGPKRREGDKQTPEGLYFLERFNANSRFHLSLQVSYPNESDRIKTENPNAPGSDIMIHGGCASIGCLAMTDDVIKEIYVMAIHSASNGQQKIPVYIFPFAMTDRNMERYLREYPHLDAFWNNLREGYERFMATGQELQFSVDAQGDYVYKERAN